MSYSVTIPDFAGTLARGEQTQMSRLQAMALRESLADQQAFRGTASEVLPQLGTAEGPTRLSLLSRLAGSGLQGAQLALPMLTQERDRGQFQELMRNTFGGGAPAPAPAAAPAALPASAPAATAGTAAPRGEAPAAVTAGIEARRALDPNSPTYAQDIMRINDGVVAQTMPGGRPAQPAAPPAAAPAAAPRAQGLPTPQQLFMLMASGNPQAMAFARSVAPLVAQSNPNWTSVTADGQVWMVNPQNPQQRVSMGRPQGALTPQPGYDAEGRPVLLFPDGQGNLVQGQTPPGVTVAPRTRDINTGTEIVTIDQGGQIVARRPVDIRGREREERIGAQEGTDQAAAPQAVRTAEETLAQIDGVLNHRALTAGTGITGRVLNAIPGTPTYDFSQRVEQLQGRAFLQAFETLKGGGQITEVEGRKATAAIARLSTAQSAGDFRTALTELRGIVEAARDRARARTGAAPTGQATVPGPNGGPADPPPPQQGGGWSIRPVQ